MRRFPFRLWTCRSDETMAAAHQISHFSPIEASRVDLQRNPAVLPDIGRAEETGIIEKNPLQFHFNLNANSQLALVFLERSEHSAIDPKCRMAEGDSFRDAGETHTNLAQPLQDLSFTQHLGNEACIR